MSTALSAPASLTPRLVKLLELSDSSFDGEALAATRKANQLLAEHYLRWEQFFNALGADISVEDSPTDEHENASATDLITTIQAKFGSLTVSQKKWFIRLQKAHRRTGRLSARQHRVLADIVRAVA